MPGRNQKPRSLDHLYPGPQKEIRRSLSTNRFLMILIAIALVLFLQSVAHDNYQRLKFPGVLSGIWSMQILDNKSAATMIIGLLSLAFVNRQVILAYRPFLNYRSQKTNSSTFALGKESNAKEFWVVKLQNVGSGPAIVTQSLYRVSATPGILGKYEEYDGALRNLTAAGLTNGEDFVLRFLSHGWALAARDECILGELNLPKAMNVYALDIRVEFKGLLGDTYTKEIYCIPRNGIYPNNPHVPLLDSTKAAIFPRT